MAVSRKPSGLLGLAIVGVILAGMAGAAALKFVTAPEPQRSWGGGAVPVTLASVDYRQWNDRLNALGTARSRESVDITAQITETVSRIHFEDGQTVEKGTVLLEFTDAEEAAALAESRATLLEAQQQYERIRDLQSRGTATASQLETAQAVRSRARARMNAIEAQLADRLIRAPFDGVLGFRNVSEGSLIRPGDTITTLDDISLIKFDFSLPETVLAKVAAGQAIEAHSAAFPDTVFPGTVTAVDTRIDPVSRSFTVRAEVPNPDGMLRPGMLLTANVLVEERVALVVPEAAIVPMDDRSFVFRLAANDTVERVEVRVGARRPGEVEIGSGLKTGDLIVVEGTLKLRDGATIERTGQEVPRIYNGEPLSN